MTDLWGLAYLAIRREILVLTNFVPAVAVKRRGRVLLELTGCKACVDGNKSAK